MSGPGETLDAHICPLTAGGGGLGVLNLPKATGQGQQDAGWHVLVFLSLLGSKLENSGTHRERMGRAEFTCPACSASRPRGTTSSQELSCYCCCCCCCCYCCFLLVFIVPFSSLPPACLSIFLLIFFSFWVLKMARIFLLHLLSRIRHCSLSP